MSFKGFNENVSEPSLRNNDATAPIKLNKIVKAIIDRLVAILPTYSNNKYPNYYRDYTHPS